MKLALSEAVETMSAYGAQSPPLPATAIQGLAHSPPCSFQFWFCHDH